MAKRGIYKQGNYLALLYALDTHYQLEALRKGERPAHWQPQPRNQVEQFLSLITASLGATGVRIPKSYTAFLELLKTENLAYVAKMLAYILERRLDKLALKGELRLDLDRVSVETLRTRLHIPSVTTEQHPQARKLKQTIIQNLDGLWWQTVRELEREQRAKWPSVSIILGSVPPDFRLVHAQVSKGLAASGHAELFSELSVTQFYSFTTGTFPKPKKIWEPSIKQLHALGEDDIALLKGLSKRQAKQLSTLSRQAFYLVLALRSIRQATSAWRGVIEKIYHLENNHAAKRLLARWKRVYKLDIRQLEAIRDLLDPQTWQQVKALDEELIFLIDRGDINLSLFFRLQTWNKKTWSAIQATLKEDWIWVTSYLEDERMAQANASLRTPARLDLNTLYPKSVAWLSGLAQRNLESLLVRDLETVVDYARDYAQLANARLRQAVNVL